MGRQEGFAWFGVAIFFGLMRYFASSIYDFFIIKMTEKWYAAVLARLGQNERVLDVGIGTATALLRNKESIKEKNVKVVGVDYEDNYIKAARKSIAQEGMEAAVKVHCKSIFDDDLEKIIRKTGSEEQFDCAYFSGSWTLMPEPVRALRIAAALVKDDGKIYVTQTFQRANNPLNPFFALIKPFMKSITTIDFGSLHYESDLADYIKQAEAPQDGWSLKVVENAPVKDSIDNRLQVAKLVVFSKVRN